MKAAGPREKNVPSLYRLIIPTMFTKVSEPGHGPWSRPRSLSGQQEGRGGCWVEGGQETGAWPEPRLGCLCGLAS